MLSDGEALFRGIFVDDKIYSGALSLLGILVAFFTFALFLSEGASSANEHIRIAFVVLTGALVFGCALSGIISIINLAVNNWSTMGIPQQTGFWIFAGVLGVTALTPILIWIATTWFLFFS